MNEHVREGDDGFLYFGLYANINGNREIKFFRFAKSESQEMANLLRNIAEEIAPEGDIE